MEVKLSEEAEDKLADRIVEKLIAKNNSKKDSEQSKKEKLYKVSDVVDNTGQSESTVTRHIREGLLIASKVGKFWLINEENYKNYINNDTNYK